MLQPVSCALTRFSALSRFHNDKSLVDLTATAAAADDDDGGCGGGGGGGSIATVFNARVAFPVQQTAPPLYNRFCMNVESAAPDYYKLVSYEDYSKINIRLVGKNKRVVIASKRTLSSNKELLFLLHA